MANLEAIAPFGISRLHIDPLNACGRRALVQLIDELPDSMFVPLKMRLDTAIRSVPYPADNPKRSCLFGGPGAEEHALHPAVDFDGLSDAHGQRPSFKG